MDGNNAVTKETVGGWGTNPAIKNDLLLKFPSQSQRSGNKRKCADSAAQSAHRQ